MNEEIIKESFLRVKEDIASLVNELYSLRSEIDEMRSFLSQLQSQLGDLNSIKAILASFPTIQQINPTYSVIPTDNPTVPQEIGGLKGQISAISTGNRGVPTDSQTDNPTNQQTQTPVSLPTTSSLQPPQNASKLSESPTIESNIQEAKEMLDSLDQLKKQIRLKFRLITPQEMTVFSTIYQMEEIGSDPPTYRDIAKRLGLSESSIRDYVLKIVGKGIPIRKSKINNKKVVLSISPELKKIATLSTILKLRES